MRVICGCLGDFLENLKSEPPSSVLQRVVHVSVVRRPLDGDKHSSVKFQVAFRASAVIGLEDGGQYLLDCGEDCGVDYHDASNEQTGSQVAAVLKEQLMGCCDVLGLTVRPGIIQE